MQQMALYTGSVELKKEEGGGAKVWYVGEGGGRERGAQDTSVYLLKLWDEYSRTGYRLDPLISNFSITHNLASVTLHLSAYHSYL